MFVYTVLSLSLGRRGDRRGVVPGGPTSERPSTGILSQAPAPLRTPMRPAPTPHTVSVDYPRQRQGSMKMPACAALLRSGCRRGGRNFGSVGWSKGDVIDRTRGGRVTMAMSGWVAMVLAAV